MSASMRRALAMARAVARRRVASFGRDRKWSRLATRDQLQVIGGGS